MLKRAIPILAVTALMLNFSSCSCIYFNTFHNIRTNFSTAEKSRKQANREKAAGSETKQYNDAIAKASKVLERHPGSSWVDDALFIIGSSYYRLGDYDKSARKFKELFANFPQSEYISPSRLLYAKDKIMLKEEAEGVVLFEEILSKERNKEMRAEAARSLGQYYFDAKEYEKAIVYFQALIDSLGQDSDKLQALTFMADGYFDLYRFDKAYADYGEALKHNPDTLQLYRLNFRMAQCDYFLNRFQDGLSRLGELADKEFYPLDSVASIRLMMARGYEWDGDLESAINTYEKVIEENPKKNQSAVAYYELGLIYQYDLEDLTKARDYYTKAREEKSGSPIYADATKRASMLTLLKQYSAADTTITKPGAAKPKTTTPTTGADTTKTAADSTATVFDTTAIPVDTTGIIIPYAPPDMTAAAIDTTKTGTPSNKNLSPEIIIPLAPPDTPAAVIDTAASRMETAGIGASEPAVPLINATQVMPGQLETTGIDTTGPAVPSINATRVLANQSETVGIDTTGPAVPLIDATRILAGQSETTGIDTTGPAVPLIDATRVWAGQSETAGVDMTGPAVPLIDATHVMANPSDATKPGTAKAGVDRTSSGPKNTPKADSAQAAEAARLALQKEIDQAGLNLFHLGELFYVDLERPDSALHTFATLLERYPESRQAPRALIAMSHIYKTDYTDTAAADSLLRLVLRDYPRYDEVQDAVGLLGLAGTAADSGYAALSYNRAETFYDRFQALDSTQFYLRLEADSGSEAVQARKGSDYLNGLRLLDSARHYFRFVADSFPQSAYYVQAHYVLLTIVETYLTPGDSTLVDQYEAFADSFPGTPYASSVSAQVAAFKAPLRKQTPAEEKDELESDSTAALAAADSTAADSTGAALDTLTGVSRFIADEKGNQLPPAMEYFDREEVPFKYPLEAVAYNIQDKLYFHIRIDFSGAVVDIKLMNPTQSPELNANASETVKHTKFLTGRIPPDLYDHWFYYTYTVTMPPEYRQ